MAHDIDFREEDKLEATAWIVGHFREMELDRKKIRQERDKAMCDLKSAKAHSDELKTLVRDLCRKMTALKKEKNLVIKELNVLKQAEAKKHAHESEVAARHKRKCW